MSERRVKKLETSARRLGLVTISVCRLTGVRPASDLYESPSQPVLLPVIVLTGHKPC